MDPIILVFLGVVLLAIPILAFFGLIALAAFIYIWAHAYPWLKMIGKWAARPANFVGLIIVEVLLLAGIVFAYLGFTAIGGLWGFLIILILLALVLLLFIAAFPVYLAIIVWEIRLLKWGFTRISGSLDGVFLAARLEFIKLKIKTDTFKGGGGRGTFGAMKGGVSGDVRRVRGKVSGKKEMGFKGKLEALKGEFSGDVRKARGKLSKRK